MSETARALGQMVGREDVKMNPREEIVALLRGQVACPVISCLGQLGWIDRMLEGPFDVRDFGPSVDPRVFRSIMTYLRSMGLLQRTIDQRLTTTVVGQQVLRRYGAFCIINSYESYMQRVRSLLVPNGERKPQVDRLRNVIGSGALHTRKFFVPALDLLAAQPFTRVVDVGCGDGRFLLTCLERFPDASLLAVDLSPVAVEETSRRLRMLPSKPEVHGVVADGADVACWSQHLQRLATSRGSTLISLWFLVHEISHGEVQVVVDFFRRLHSLCPGATVLMGEVVRIHEDWLAFGKSESVLPELTLLHELSGQGLLSWAEWQQIADEIPYIIVNKRLFDHFRGPDDTTQPSSFVWCLDPR
jgi:SAM-dependent methyltransferase